MDKITWEAVDANGEGWIAHSTRWNSLYAIHRDSGNWDLTDSEADCWPLESDGKTPSTPPSFAELEDAKLYCELNERRV